MTPDWKTDDFLLAQLGCPIRSNGNGQRVYATSLSTGFWEDSAVTRDMVS
jgi:hypothetical protein